MVGNDVCMYILKGKVRTLVEKSCLIFLTRSDGGSCPYRKNRQKKRNLNLHFGREFVHFRARVLRDEITFRHSKFLPNRDRALLECRPAESGYFPTKIRRKSEAVLRDLIPRPRFEIRLCRERWDYSFVMLNFFPVATALF